MVTTAPGIPADASFAAISALVSVLVIFDKTAAELAVATSISTSRSYVGASLRVTLALVCAAMVMRVGAAVRRDDIAVATVASTALLTVNAMLTPAVVSRRSLRRVASVMAEMSMSDSLTLRSVAAPFLNFASNADLSPSTSVIEVLSVSVALTGKWTLVNTMSAEVTSPPNVLAIAAVILVLLTRVMPLKDIAVCTFFLVGFFLPKKSRSIVCA
mmetsp:Transcript_36930/g.59315  ORF Transcript_36930/g.59315 Transcript_36930/m.59315 type:complete len:215 (+) Transcript_36930:2260-2904(+)